MYLDDPTGFVRPYKPQPQRKVDPRLLAFAQERVGGAGHTVGKPMKGFTPEGVCLHVNGRHACYDYRDFCPLVPQGKTWTEPRETPIIFRTMRPVT